MVRQSVKRMWDFLIGICHLEDSSHRLAFGGAIGMFVAFTPTIPFQMVLTVFFSWILRANKVVGIPMVWITNPVTVVPIYFIQYAFGCLVLGIPIGDTQFSVFTQTDLPFDEYWANAATVLGDTLKPLIVGSILSSIILGTITYIVLKKFIEAYRARRSQ